MQKRSSFCTRFNPTSDLAPYGVPIYDGVLQLDITRLDARPKIVRQLSGVLIALRGVLLQGALENGLCALRQIRAKRSDRSRRLMRDLEEQGGNILCLERLLAREQFEQDNAERKNIGTPVHVVSGHLFR